MSHYFQFFHHCLFLGTLIMCPLGHVLKLSHWWFLNFLKILFSVSFWILSIDVIKFTNHFFCNVPSTINPILLFYMFYLNCLSLHLWIIPSDIANDFLYIKCFLYFYSSSLNWHFFPHFMDSEKQVKRWY